ncbi:MAG: hypothetical protein M3O28_11895 [Actinomycetota bacterium]|nr:hypothetical protein [Actinomycetota bacterium]
MRSDRKWLAAGTGIALATLLWPGPAASADTTLGGYTGSATAQVLHVEVFDPTIPIPASPQAEGSIAYSRSSVDSGPTSRALASYLWPGSVIGDGFDQLTMQPGSKYPVQVNSRFPATPDAPAKNAVQLTDGNGMATATDGFTTNASVTGLGLAGPGTNPLGGLGAGLGQLGGSAPSSSAATPALPLPISSSLAALVTAQHVTSSSTTTVAGKTLTSTAHAAVSNLSLLSGLIDIKGLDVTSTVVSDGAKATSTGTATIGSLTVAGVPLAISDSGVNLGLPVLSQTLSGILKTLGLSIAAIPVTNKVNGAKGEFHAQALQISIDTKPFTSVVDSVLTPLIGLFPADTQNQLAPLLSLGPKIVLTVGDTDAIGNASPAFAGGSGGSSTGTGTSGGSTGAGSHTTGTGSAGNTTSLSPGTPGTPGSGSAPGVSNAPTAVQPVALGLPGLGAIPRMLIIGGLLLAGLIGLLMRQAGAILLGGTRNCDRGLVTGLPNLRRG